MDNELVNKVLYGKTVTDLPDEIDPVVLVRKYMKTCPFCNSRDHISCEHYEESFRDNEGIQHKILRYKNKYEWRKDKYECYECESKWETDWYPTDHKMFTVRIDDRIKG